MSVIVSYDWQRCYMETDTSLFLLVTKLNSINMSLTYISTDMCVQYICNKTKKVLKRHDTIFII